MRQSYPGGPDRLLGSEAVSPSITGTEANARLVQRPLSSLTVSAFVSAPGIITSFSVKRASKRAADSLFEMA